MTRTYAKTLLPIIQAFSEGQTIQFRYLDRYEHTDNWMDFGSNDTMDGFDEFEYRIKPTPKLRAWNSASEIPIGAITRTKEDGANGIRQMILWVGMHHACLSCSKAFSKTNGYGMDVDFKGLLEIYEHSTDNGATWKPCGVEDAA